MADDDDARDETPRPRCSRSSRSTRSTRRRLVSTAMRSARHRAAGAGSRPRPAAVVVLVGRVGRGDRWWRRSAVLDARGGDGTARARREPRRLAVDRAGDGDSASGADLDGHGDRRRLLGDRRRSRRPPPTRRPAPRGRRRTSSATVAAAGARAPRRRPQRPGRAAAAPRHSSRRLGRSAARPTLPAGTIVAHRHRARSTAATRSSSTSTSADGTTSLDAVRRPIPARSAPLD